MKNYLNVSSAYDIVSAVLMGAFFISLPYFTNSVIVTLISYAGLLSVISYCKWAKEFLYSCALTPEKADGDKLICKYLSIANIILLDRDWETTDNNPA